MCCANFGGLARYEAIMKKKDAKVAAADKLRAKRKAIDGEKTKKKRKKATN